MKAGDRVRLDVASFSKGDIEMKDWQDCGFRDQREVDRYYGRCPDCGDYKSPRCHCDVEDVEQKDPTPEQVDAYNRMQEEHPECPF